MKNRRSILDAVPTPDNERSWYDVIGKFKDSAAHFKKTWDDLEKNKMIAYKSPKTRKEFDALNSRAISIKKSVEKVTTTVGGAWDWLKAQTGLGFVPLIPIAVVAGSVALMGKWVADAVVFNRKMDALKELTDKGIPVERAAAMIEAQDSGNTFDSIRKLIPVLIVGVAVLAVLPKLLKGKR